MAQDSQHASPGSPGSLQNGEPLPLLPQSPDSLSQGEVFANHHPNTLTTDTSDRIHPASLHLKPVTWKSLAKINFPSGERFEIVDGLLVWVPMGNGIYKHQLLIRALVEFINLLGTWRAISCLDVEVESISGNSSAANSRSPDVIITQRRPGSPTDSSASERTSRKHVLLTKDKPAYAQIEVTSQSTRTTDLTAKWVQYCATGVNFYYIIDLYGRETFDVARVIVGSKAGIRHWTRCDNGDPDGASSSSSPNTQTYDGFYYKKVYTGNDQIDVGIFRDSPLSASQLISSTFLNQRVEEIKQQNGEKDRRIEGLSREKEDLSREKEDLSRQNASQGRRIEDLSRRNASKDEEIQTLRTQLARERGSFSKSRRDTERTKANHKPSSSSHRQSTESQPASPTKSPEKKRHKRRK